ncbi:MAG: thioredoxin-disulfide reductase [Acidobacteria bacterium]|nr:MAG: thioredoxin-disulfide reductase [Acidobacteriota bacterium]
MTEETHDLVIVGAGPAGLTAAIYAARGLLNPVVVEGDLGPGGEQPGGQLMLTTEVENFPGFPDGVLGPELIDLFRKQAERFGARFVEGRAELSGTDDSRHLVQVGSEAFRAQAVILATGASARMLDIPGESELLGMGVSTCATCDGAFFRDREIAIVGGGDSAMEEALFLTRFASKVLVIHRRDELRASKIMQERAFAEEKIEFVWNSEVTEVLGENSVEGVRLRNTATGDESTLDLSGLFIAIGHVPNTDFVKGVINLDENGYISTHERTRTSVEGIFAAGDALDHVYRQAITASAQGCMAAIDAGRWLESVSHGVRPEW